MLLTECTCLTHHPLSLPLSLSFSQVINYETEGSVEVSVRQEEGRTVSTLLVARAALHHSGRYHCAPSNTDRATIMVHVFKGEWAG